MGYFRIYELTLGPRKLWGIYKTATKFDQNTGDEFIIYISVTNTIVGFLCHIVKDPLKRL